MIGKIICLNFEVKHFQKLNKTCESITFLSRRVQNIKQYLVGTFKRLNTKEWLNEDIIF